MHEGLGTSSQSHLPLNDVAYVEMARMGRLSSPLAMGNSIRELGSPRPGEKERCDL